MSKGLEDLEWLIKNGYIKLHNWQEDVIMLDCVDNIEKELKALEIIKKLSTEILSDLLFFIRNDKDATYEEFAEWFGTETPLVINRDEFDLLKENLK